MSRLIFRYHILIAVILITGSLGFAADQPVMMESGLDKPDKIWVGQRVDLNVTLYTTSSFSGVPRFDLPEVSSMVITADDTHPIMGSKNIDGSSYIYKQYTVSLFPLQTGKLTIPSLKVTFGYQGNNFQTRETTLPTTAQAFTVLDVPGRNPDLSLITATELKVDDQWDPEPGKATVGDAFDRTITMTATGLPGMAFPPLEMKQLEGLAIYSRQPQVSTDTQRGAYIGKRVETYSCVCQKAGKYILPEMKLQWWNPAGEELKVVKLDSVTFQVTPNPLLETKETGAVGEASDKPVTWRRAIAAALIIVAAFLLILLLRRKNKRSGQVRKETEKALFKKFKHAAESNNAAETMQTLIQWLNASGLTSGFGDVSEFIRLTGDPSLQQQIVALEDSLYSTQKKSWSGITLYKKVAEARKKLLHHRHIHQGQRYALGPLNPVCGKAPF